MAPETITLQRELMISLQSSSPTPSTKSVSGRTSREKRRIERTAPFTATAGDRTDPRTVGQSGVDDRRRSVDPTTDRGEDPLDEVLHPLLIEVAGVQQRSMPIDPDVAVGVDHDLVDAPVGEQPFEFAEPVESGDRSLRQSSLVIGDEQGSETADLVTDDLAEIADLARRMSAQFVDGPVLQITVSDVTVVDVTVVDVTVVDGTVGRFDHVVHAATRRS